MGFNSAFKGLMKKCSRCIQPNEPIYVNMINDMMICLLTAIGLTPGGSNTVHIYTQTIHRATQLTTLVGRLSGIRIQRGQTKINDELPA